MLATPAMGVVEEEVEEEVEVVVALEHKVPAAVVGIVLMRPRSAQSGATANARPIR